MPVVWFIRHGESESNADFRTSHPAQTALTPKGVTEAEAIVKSFVEKPSLIVVSPYLRALVGSLLTGVYEATPETMTRYSRFVRAVRMPNGAIFKTAFDGDGEVNFSGFDIAHLHVRIRSK